MKIKLLFFCFFLSATAVNAYDLDKIRLNFVKSIEDKTVAQNLLLELESIKSKDAIIMAYKGSVKAIMGKHAWNPVNKLNYLKQGCKTIDKAVELESENIEIRFLRFSLEHYLPSFLGFSNHLVSDKVKIIQLLKSNTVTTHGVNESIKKQIIKFLIDSKRCTANETHVLKSIN